MAPIHTSDSDEWSNDGRFQFWCDNDSSSEDTSDEPPSKCANARDDSETKVTRPRLERKSRSNKCLNRNAIMARENRIRKKKYLETIENEVALLRKQSAQLTKELKEVNKKNKVYKKQLIYLKGVLKSRTNITSLLKGLNDSLNRKPENQIPITVAESLVKPESPSTTSNDLMNDIDPFISANDSLMPEVGICLHIASGMVSLGYCPHCNFSSLDNEIFF